MVRVDLHPKFLLRLHKLSTSDVAAVEAALIQLRNGFGQPHLHGGLGLRRLRRNLFECRAGLELRILFWVKAGTVTVFEVLTHDEVRAFLRNF
jgi:mRNA-degrading endonuclease RelE of RelBE toxin-antitoxin system